MHKRLMRLYWRIRNALGETVGRLRGQVATCNICGTHVLSYWGGWGPDDSGYCYNCYDEHVAPRDEMCDMCECYAPEEDMTWVRMNDTLNAYNVCPECVDKLVPARAFC